MGFGEVQMEAPSLQKWLRNARSTRTCRREHSNGRGRAYPTSAFDIGVLITEQPIPRPIAEINRAPLDSSWVDREVRIVGFGQSAAADSQSMGQRNSGVPPGRGGFLLGRGRAAREIFARLNIGLGAWRVGR